MPRFFTLPEAEELLPDVQRCLLRAQTAAADMREAERELRAVANHILSSGGARVDTGRAAACKARLEAAADALKREIEAIQANGAVLKDIDAGLIDFPALYAGREVCLCWKLGEPAIGFWHGADEGFAGRKPVDAQFAEGLAGGSQHDA